MSDTFSAGHEVKVVCVELCYVARYCKCWFFLAFIYVKSSTPAAGETNYPLGTNDRVIPEGLLFPRRYVPLLERKAVIAKSASLEDTLSIFILSLLSFRVSIPRFL